MIHNEQRLSFLNSAVINGRDVQAWLTDLPETRGLIPCISCRWCLVHSARPLLLPNILLDLHMHVELILIFQSDPGSDYICEP
jgi:hypothetical protein